MPESSFRPRDRRKGQTSVFIYKMAARGYSGNITQLGHAVRSARETEIVAMRVPFESTNFSRSPARKVAIGYAAFTSDVQ